MLECLRDQGAVEGIAVQWREICEVPERRFLDRQARNSVGLALPWEVNSRGLRNWKLPQPGLDDRLPHRGNAQIHRVGRVAYRVPECERQLRVGADVPGEDVRIEQEPHAPSNSARISSGRGRSNSAGTVNRPAHRPKGRGWVAGAGTGRTSASACSPSTTRNDSPVSTRRRNARRSR